MREITKHKTALFLAALIMGAALNAYAAKVAIVTNVDNPDYKTCRDTFERELKKAAVDKSLDVEVVTLDTKGNKEQFLAEVKKMEPDVAVFFVPGTPNALALKEAGITKPIIFNAVAGPVGAKLVNSLEAPGTNFTGVHCAVPEERQLKALLLTLHNVRKIGLMYTGSNPSSVGQAKAWKAAIANSPELQVVEFIVPDSCESEDALGEITKEAIGKVDCLVTPADARISSYSAGMLRIANANGIPTYSSLTSFVRQGALVSLGFDFAEGAKLSVGQALDIINGKSPTIMPVLTYPQYKLMLNIKSARELKLDFTLEAVKTASEIIKE